MEHEIDPAQGESQRGAAGFTMTEFMVVLATLALLSAIVFPVLAKSRAKSRLEQCIANLQQVGRAVSLYADDHKGALPQLDSSPPPGEWWYFKEQVKGYLGLTGPSSSRDKVFACPMDRGYGEGGDQPQPFYSSKKHDYTSYNLNSINLPGIPNIAGWQISAVKDPAKTLSVMEWTAHA